MQVADAAQSPVVDYYAAAIAFFVVTMFAKFATHKANVRTKERWACICHQLCVWASFVGVVLALAMLGLGDRAIVPADCEIYFRGAVGTLVVIAALILAGDIAITSARKQ